MGCGDEWVSGLLSQTEHWTYERGQVPGSHIIVGLLQPYNFNRPWEPTSHHLRINLEKIEDSKNYKMLIKETHNDVATKADGKDGSMSSFGAYPVFPAWLTILRNFPLPPIYTKLPKRVCAWVVWWIEVLLTVTSRFPGVVLFSEIYQGVYQSFADMTNACFANASQCWFDSLYVTFTLVQKVRS